MHIYNFCVDVFMGGGCAHVCHSSHEEVRGQLAHKLVHSFRHVVDRLGGKWLYPQGHPAAVLLILCKLGASWSHLGKGNLNS